MAALKWCSGWKSHGAHISGLRVGTASCLLGVSSGYCERGGDRVSMMMVTRGRQS